jgi:hypothetical protein
VFLIVAVAVAKGLRSEPSVQDFIARYPGIVEPSHPEASSGFPAWLRLQHFFNLFLLIFIIRAGVQILSDHPRLYWTRHSTPGRDWFRIQNPVPADPLWTAKQDSISLPAQIGLPGLRHSIGLARWWHLGVDALWLLNGAIFYVLLFATGHWRHLVPTSWAVFPNAVSVLIQYLSLNWPLDNGWVAYNSLQLIAYFITVFVAAPSPSSPASACHPRSRRGSSGSARGSAFRPRARCTSSCWSGSWSSSWFTRRWCSRPACWST